MKRSAAVVLVVLLAGCMSPQPEATSTSQGTASMTGTSSAPPASAPTSCPAEGACACPPGTKAMGAQGCQPYPTYALRLEVLEGRFDVAIPFPHGSWCIQPSEWMQAPREEDATSVTLETVERGAVLRMQGNGPAHAEIALNVTGRATCQTFRADPWSIDPDVMDGIEVRSATDQHVRAFVIDMADGCTTTVAYVGNVTAGWTTLKAFEPGTTCA